MKKDISLLIIRVFSGGLMAIAHGWPKMMKLINGNTEFSDPVGVGGNFTLWFATFSEVACALLLISGLFARLATIPLILTMIIAIFFVHIDHGLPKQELPLLYLSMYVVILIQGAGKYSLDTYLRKK